MFNFGSGTLIFTPFGNNAAGNPTPTQLGTMQDVTVDIAASQKELYGKAQFPVAIARTAGKLNMKAKFATINAKTLNDMFFGDTVVAGQKIGIIDERHAQTGSALVTHSAAYAEDLGVRDYTTGRQLTRVAATPSDAQYVYNSTTGLYTFSSTDTADKLVTYTYTNSTSGKSVTVTNRPMGAMPTFSVVLQDNQYGSNFMLKFFFCIAAKLSMNLKNEDFTIPDMDFSAFADASGNLFEWDMDE